MNTRIVMWAAGLVLVAAVLLSGLPSIAGSEHPDVSARLAGACLPGTASDREDNDDCETSASTEAPVKPEVPTAGASGTGSVDSCTDNAPAGCPDPSVTMVASQGDAGEPEQRDANQGDDAVGDGVADITGTCPGPPNAERRDADGDGSGDACADDPVRTSISGEASAVSVPAADETSIEVYCQIPDASRPDARIVGTFVNARSGFGDPTVTFTLYDLAGNVIAGNGPPPVTGPPPLPAANPVTAAAPYPNTWEWGPGGYAKLTVSATYPSLDPAVPDATSSLTIACVPDAPTPTPPPPPTLDPSLTPTPSPTPAGYTPQLATEMRDTAGNVIPDGATVSPGTGIIDIVTISGLPPGTNGTVIYTLFRDNCSTFLGQLGFGVSVVADASGVAIAPASPVFTVPGVPGGFYDWRIVYTDAATGFVYSGCGLETFHVPPPLPDQGTGNARLTCFLTDPPEPGRAGYKVNVSPLPATGTVEVNVTLQLGQNVYDYTTVTLPPGTPQDLEFYGAYTYAWANIVFRNDAGAVYAVVNLEGACAAIPGPTPTPSPTPTATSTATATASATATPTAASTATATATATSTVAGTAGATATPTTTATPTSTPPAHTATATGTAPPHTEAPSRTPHPTTAPPATVASLPNTGAGDGDTGNAMRILLLVLAAAILAGCAVLPGRGPAEPRDQRWPAAGHHRGAPCPAGGRGASTGAPIGGRERRRGR